MVQYFFNVLSRCSFQTHQCLFLVRRYHGTCEVSKITRRVHDLIRFSIVHRVKRSADHKFQTFLCHDVRLEMFLHNQKFLYLYRLYRHRFFSKLRPVLDFSRQHNAGSDLHRQTQSLRSKFRTRRTRHEEERFEHCTMTEQGSNQSSNERTIDVRRMIT